MADSSSVDLAARGAEIDALRAELGDETQHLAPGVSLALGRDVMPPSDGDDAADAVVWARRALGLDAPASA